MTNGPPKKEADGLSRPLTTGILTTPQGNSAAPPVNGNLRHLVVSVDAVRKFGAEAAVVLAWLTSHGAGWVELTGEQVEDALGITRHRQHRIRQVLRPVVEFKKDYRFSFRVRPEWTKQCPEFNNVPNLTMLKTGHCLPKPEAVENTGTCNGEQGNIVKNGTLFPNIPFPSTSLSTSTRKEKSTRKGRGGRAFQRPTLDEVKTYAATIDLSELEAEKFWTYYESNGWRVGKNSMKSWTIAAQGWKLRANSWSSQSASEQVTKTANIDKILRAKELLRVEERLRMLRSSYDAHQSPTAHDAAEMNRLIARRKELQGILGFHA